jgi:hypothetical protein
MSPLDAAIARIRTGYRIDFDPAPTLGGFVVFHAWRIGESWPCDTADEAKAVYLRLVTAETREAA